MDEVQLKESRNLLESQGAIFAARASLTADELKGMVRMGVAEAPQGERWVAYLPAGEELSPNLEKYIEPVLRWSANTRYETRRGPTLS